MLEQTRLDYLQAMGITQWMPREALPYAPEPRWLPEVAANHHSHAEVEQLAQSHHIPQVLAAELLTVGDAAEKASHQQASKAAEIEQKAEQAAAVMASGSVVSGSATADIVDLTPPRFELHFLRLSKAAIWICSDHNELDLMMRFAQRVMTGMQHPLDILQAPHTFRWPFIESSHQDQGAAVAQQALAAQWQHFSSQGVCYVIAFGEAAKTWLPGAGAQLDFSAESVQAVMHSAALKRDLWQVLLKQDVL